MKLISYQWCHYKGTFKYFSTVDPLCFFQNARVGPSIICIWHRQYVDKV